MEEADHGTPCLIPGLRRLLGGHKVHRASLPREIVGRLVRELDEAELAGADDQPFSPFLADVLGLVQGYDV